MCRPCGTLRFVVCRIVLPGFRPWRDVGARARCEVCEDIRRGRAATLWRFFLIYDLRFAICGVRGDIRGGGVLPRMQGIPPLTAFAAEWRGPPEGTGGRWAAREKAPATARPSPPPISLFSPRLRRTIPRNASSLSGISRFAICDLRGASSRYCTAASPCAGLLGFCPFGTAQGKSYVSSLTSQDITAL